MKFSNRLLSGTHILLGLCAFPYIIFHPLAAVQKNIDLVVFAIISLLGIWVALNGILKQAVPTKRQAAESAGLLTGLADQKNFHKMNIKE